MTIVYILLILIKMIQMWLFLWNISWKKIKVVGELLTSFNLNDLFNVLSKKEKCLSISTFDY